MTARGDEVDRVVGLELGADDYIVKPFGFRELVARIRAVTPPRAARGGRRRRRRGRSARSSIDVRTHRVTVDGEELALTPKEFDLLALLAEEPGARVHPRATILEQVWDPHWYGPTKTLDVHVASLRKKLGDPRWIETVRGVGFRLGDPPRPERTDGASPAAPQLPHDHASSSCSLLEIPLGLVVRATEQRRRLTASVQRDALALSIRAEEGLEAATSPRCSELVAPVPSATPAAGSSSSTATARRRRLRPAAVRAAQLLEPPGDPRRARGPEAKRHTVTPTRSATTSSTSRCRS